MTNKNYSPMFARRFALHIFVSVK